MITPTHFKLPKNYSAAILLFLLSILFFSVSFGQSPLGKVSGKITDRNDQPIENATIRVEGKSGAMSNASGESSISIPPGHYKWSVSFFGYAMQTIKVV